MSLPYGVTVNVLLFVSPFAVAVIFGFFVAETGEVVTVTRSSA